MCKKGARVPQNRENSCERSSGGDSSLDRKSRESEKMRSRKGKSESCHLAKRKNRGIRKARKLDGSYQRRESKED